MTQKNATFGWRFFVARVSYSRVWQWFILQDRECRLLYMIMDLTRRQRRQAWRLLLASLAVLGIGLVPLLSQQALYLDDMSRTLDGYFGWGLNARPAAEGVMRLLGFGGELVNVAPLPQLAAWGIAAGMALVWWRRVPGLSPGVCVLGNALIWLTPFTLQNFSYAYDSLPMSLGLASAMLASLILRPGVHGPGQRSQRRWQPSLMALGLLLLALCCYQPALNAFLVLSLLDALMGSRPRGVERREAEERNTEERKFEEGKTEQSESVWRAWLALLQRGGLVLAALLLYLPLSRLLVAGDYSQQHGEMLSLGDLPALLAALEQHLVQALAALRGGLDLVSGALSGSLLVVALGAALMTAGRRHGARQVSSRQLTLERLSRLLWALLLIPALWGPMLMLAEPVFHSRTLVGWGALLGGALMLSLAGRQARASERFTLRRCLLGVAALLLLRHWLIFAAWSNALAAQQAHETQLAREIVTQARELGLPITSPRDRDTYRPDDELAVQVLGKAPLAPLARVAERQVPAVRQNLIAAFTPDNYWAVVRLRMAGASAATLLRDDEGKASIKEPPVCDERASVDAPGDEGGSPRIFTQTLREGVWVIDFRTAENCRRADVRP